MIDSILGIAVIADIHWGASSVLTERLYANLLQYFIEDLKKRKPKIIVIAGDYWHMKLSLNSTEASYGNAFINTLRSEFPETYILLIKGTRAHDLNQLDLFKPFASKYFRVYETVTVDYIEDMRLLIIPEEYYQDKSVYDKYLNVSEKYDWVFFHGLFSHAGSYALTEGGRLNKICFDSKDFTNIVYGRVVGGHIHDPIVHSIVDYCGSFDRWRHGEELRKGFRYYQYDVSKRRLVSSEFIENEGSAKFITVPYEQVRGLSVDTLTAKITELAKDVVSLRIKVSKTDDVIEQDLHNLLGITFSLPNVILFKDRPSRMKTIDEQKADEAQAEERKKRIKRFDGMTFEEITISYGKEQLGVSVSEQNISEALAG